VRLSPVLLLLLRYELEWLLKHDYEYAFTTASLPSPADIYLKLGLQRAEVEPFRYDSTDPAPICLLFGEFSKLPNSELWRITQRFNLRQEDP
jgi:hypothetical protein